MKPARCGKGRHSFNVQGEHRAAERGRGINAIFSLDGERLQGLARGRVLVGGQQPLEACAAQTAYLDCTSKGGGPLVVAQKHLTRRGPLERLGWLAGWRPAPISSTPPPPPIIPPGPVSPPAPQADDP